MVWNVCTYSQIIHVPIRSTEAQTPSPAIVASNVIFRSSLEMIDNRYLFGKIHNVSSCYLNVPFRKCSKVHLDIDLVAIVQVHVFVDCLHVYLSTTLDGSVSICWFIVWFVLFSLAHLGSEKLHLGFKSSAGFLDYTGDVNADRVADADNSCRRQYSRAGKTSK